MNPLKLQDSNVLFWFRLKGFWVNADKSLTTKVQKGSDTEPEMFSFREDNSYKTLPCLLYLKDRVDPHQLSYHLLLKTICFYFSQYLQNITILVFANAS